MSTEKHAVLSFVRMGRAEGIMLAVWNKRYNCWGMPGGKVEEGETLEQAHDRELAEETGLYHLCTYRPDNVPRPKIIYSAPTYSGSGRICHVFNVGYDWSGDLYPNEVGGAVGWMPMKFMAEEPKTGPWFRDFFKAMGWEV